MTGTPLDLTPFGGIVTGIGWLYWLLTLGLLVLAIRWPKTRLRKALWSLLVVLVFGLAPGMQLREDYVANKKLRAATAQFEMRCKSAGEKVTRAVENVDGVVWMRWRDKQDNLSDQFKLDDPFGRDCGGKECIEQLLRATKGQELDPENKQHARNGYLFIETIDPQTQQLARYTRQLYRQKERDPKYAEWAIASEVVSQLIEKRTVRYGITWDDISTREDREHWIAGGSLKIVDLQTNAVIAERVGYMMDRGQGNRAGARSPWMAAPETACPAFPRSPSSHAFRSYRGQEFIFNVLKPKE